MMIFIIAKWFDVGFFCVRSIEHKFPYSLISFIFE